MIKNFLTFLQKNKMKYFFIFASAKLDTQQISKSKYVN